MIDQLDEFSAAETDQLIAEILEETPRFIEELDDMKVLDDIYDTMRWYEKETGYKWNRFKQYVFRGAEPTIERQPYGGVEFTDSKRYHAALLAMLCVMGDIFASVCKVYHLGAGRYHYVGIPSKVGERLGKVASERLLSEESDWRWAVVSDEISGLYENGVDLFDFAVFVFRFLRDRGYNWRYRSDHLDFAKHWEEGRLRHGKDDKQDEDKWDEEKYPERLVPEGVDDEDLAPGADQYRNGLATMTFESEYFQFVNEVPEEAVRAYMEVYGVEPDGYPPRMDDY